MKLHPFFVGLIFYSEDRPFEQHDRAPPFFAGRRAIVARFCQVLTRPHPHTRSSFALPNSPPLLPACPPVL